MPVSVRCRSCDEVLKLPDKARGRKVRCPHCEAPVRVPAGSSKKSAAAEDATDEFGDDDDFLQDLDLRRAEDRHARVCPKCGADVPEDDFECPQCHIDIRTGKISEKRRRKLERKGPDPAEFYRTTWSDGWRFLGDNPKLAVRTFIYLALSTVPGFALLLLSVYFHQAPLKVFFAFLTLVALLSGPGWLWHLWMEILNATLEKKQKLKRVGFDFFLNVALGIKIIMWNVIFGLPILLIPAVIAVLLANNDNLIAAGVVYGAGYLFLVPLVPISMAHFTQPVMYPGWLSPYCVKTFFKVPGPALFWVLFAGIVMLPSIAALTVGGVVGQRDVEDVVNSVRFNAALSAARDEVDLENASKKKFQSVEEEQQKPNLPAVERLGLLTSNQAVRRLLDGEAVQTIMTASQNVADGSANISLGEVTGVKFPFQKLILPGVLLVLSCGTLAVGVVYCARVNGRFIQFFKRDFDLITMVKERKYVSTTKTDEFGKTVTTRDGNALKILGGVGGVIVFYAVANAVLYFATGGEYILLPRPIAQALNLIKQ